MKIALLGTRGAPARYGGFETAVEEIGAGLAERGHEVLVYCRGGSGDTYRGMRRIVLPALHRRVLETLSHTGLSALHALRERPDVAIVFNAANAPFVALLRGTGMPTVLHVDGHDGRRAKWSGVGALYYSLATRLGVAVATAVIADSEVIGQDLRQQYGVEPVFVPYGARETRADAADQQQNLDRLELAKGKYHLVVARFEPENQVLDLIEGYRRSSARLPLVVVGFAGYPGDYVEKITHAAASDSRILLTGAVWDQTLLDALYAGAASYIHGHSVGGTNPSLLRAMVHGTPVLAFDCPYNRETTGGHATWFRDGREIAHQVESIERAPVGLKEDAERGRSRAETHYTWHDVVSRYEAMALGCVEAVRHRPSRRARRRGRR